MGSMASLFSVKRQWYALNGGGKMGHQEWTLQCEDLSKEYQGVLVAWVLRPLANELGLMQIPYQPSLIGILATAAGILLAGTPGRIRRRRLDR